MYLRFAIVQGNRTREVNSVSAMDGAAFQLRGTTQPADTRTSSNVQFLRWADPLTSSNRTFGAFLTAQNSFVAPALGVSWQPDQNWTTLGSHGSKCLLGAKSLKTADATLK